MTEFDARMAQLRARFLKRARMERGALLQAMAAGDPAEIGRIAHSLSGSGGIFGFPAISTAAQQVEEGIDGGADGTAVERLCRALLAELDRGLHEG